MSKPTPQQIGAILAAIGIFLSSLSGIIVWTTPQEQQCGLDLADARARLELYAEVKNACKTALDSCATPTKSVEPK
jgi:hypothetical protein